MEVTLRDRRLRAMHRIGRRFDVHPGLLRQGEACPGNRHDAAQLRKERGEPTVATVRPHCRHELLAREGAPAVQHEIREEKSSLASGQSLVDAFAVDEDGESTAQLHLDACQPRPNIVPTVFPYKGGRHGKADRV